MKVKLISKDVKFGENSQEKMSEKLKQRLHKYFKGEDPEVTVKISQGKTQTKAELFLVYYGYKLRSEASSIDGPFAAFDKAIDTMERQMEKSKTKMTRINRDTIKNMESDLSVDEANEDYKVVKTKVYENKPMSVQEAILQMELLGHNFFMFCNSDGNKACTVYRRNDGDYGLIELA